MPEIIRVFPRQTSMTPVDPYAFVGEPPMMRPAADEVHVSVTFTWDKPYSEHLAEAWGQYYPVKIGGPAYGSPNPTFTPGMYVREGVVFTSRGCDHKCPWCLVPSREGRLTLLPIQEGHIINDNNLLQCPHEHIEKVMDMLRRQRKPAEFPGGIDARLVDDWFAGQVKTIKVLQMFLAADTEGAIKPLERAIEKLSFLKGHKLRCYVLIGLDETIAQAESRLKRILRLGAMPFAMLYQPPDRLIEYSREWKRLRWIWTRPRAMAAMLDGVEHRRMLDA